MVTMTQNFILEVCVDSVESALSAQRGGAHRIELCGSLTEGGITPSSGLIAAVRAKVSLALHIMVRPRASDFCYSADEFRIMQQDVVAARQHGADGVVLGLLDLDGNVDTRRTRELVALAAPMKVTFHRAFDLSSDLLRSLDELRAAGVHCVLTSGGQPTAAEGADMLKTLVASAGSDLAIIAAGGINPDNVAALISRTGVRRVHASLKVSIPSAMRYQRPHISMGQNLMEQNNDREYCRFVVDQFKVESLLHAALNGRK